MKSSKSINKMWPWYRVNCIIFLGCIINLFSSDLVSQSISVCSGLKDIYVCPEEPVTPDVALLGYFTSQNASHSCFGLLEFDNFPGLTKCNGTPIPQNALFIHQIVFPVASGNVSAATLQFRAKASPTGQTGTDNISFFEGSTYITGANLSQLVEAGGTWNHNQDRSFTLNLGNLPPAFSINSILSYLNDGNLDIVIGNETGVDWMCLDVVLDTVVSDISTKYVVGPKRCKYTLIPPKAVWKISMKSIDSGGRDSTSSSLYHLQTAVLKPTSFPSPNVLLTDSLGNPVLTSIGEEIILFENNSVASKIQAIAPAPPGYGWYGLQSNSLTPSASLGVDSMSFDIAFEWFDLPLGSQDSTGAFWMSDDKDDLYQELIIDAFTLLDTSQLITSQNEIGKIGLIRIFPNPTTGILNTEIPFPAQSGMSFHVISLTGQVLLNKKLEVGTALQTMEASTISNGMYLLQIISEGRVLFVNKFVKM